MSKISAPAELVYPVPDLHQEAVTKFIEIDKTRYAYRSFGNIRSIPLIFLQHFTGTMDDWDPVITNGMARHFHVVLFDNKGIGASGGQTPNSIEAMAADAIAFINALGFRKVNLFGFSMGGFIAQQITLDSLHLVNKLVLAGTGPRGAQGLHDIVTPLNTSASMSAQEQKLFLFYSATSTSRALGLESLTRIHTRTLNRDPATGLSSVQAQLQSMLDWALADIDGLNSLSEISQPVLIVNGNNDIMIPTINSYAMYQQLPNAKLSLYPDSGHGSIFQYPELFLKEVIPFLNE